MSYPGIDSIDDPASVEYFVGEWSGSDLDVKPVANFCISKNPTVGHTPGGCLMIMLPTVANVSIRIPRHPRARMDSVQFFF